MIDLRSDTVTKPSPDMLRAMVEAEVGDDVFGDDPTVNLLQEKAAELLGKEAALFVPSGTMANQTAIRAQTQPGDEIIAHRDSHIYHYEAGAPAGLSGCVLRLLDGDRGMFSARDVRDAVRPSDSHFPHSALVVVENTHNRGGGSVWPIDAIAEIRSVADEFGLKTHLDGARLLNACVASGRPATDYTRYFDTVSICFSKGLGAPVGSAVAGTAETIRRVHRFRKMFGGGMRQAGFLAAAALYAIEQNLDRLADDHAHAKRLAQALADMPEITIDPATVETNIVYFDVTSLPDSLRSAADTAGSAPSRSRLGSRSAGASSGAASTASTSAAPSPAAVLCDALKQRGVWMLPLGPSRIRAVTHLDVTSADIDRAVSILADLFA